MKGKEREKNGEAKPKPFFCLIGVVSGRLLEILDPVGVFLVKALPAISAKARLWGSKCGRWPSLATLTCAVWAALAADLCELIPENKDIYEPIYVSRAQRSGQMSSVKTANSVAKLQDSSSVTDSRAILQPLKA